MAISKSDILNGVKQCKEIKVESLDDTTYIRKLGDGEVAEITSIIASGGEAVQSKDNPEEMEIKVSNKEAIINTRKAKHFAIAKALTNEKNSDKWKQEDISSLPSNVVAELAEKVADYSGLLNQKTFRSWSRDEG